MGDMDETDSKESRLTDGETGGDNNSRAGVERPRSDGESPAEINHSELPAGNCDSRTSPGGLTAEVQKSEEYDWDRKDRAARKGSAGSHRSRHSSGGSSSSSRKRSRSRKHLKLKPDGDSAGHESETGRPDSSQGEQVNGGHHSRTKHHEHTMNSNPENGAATDEDDDQSCSVVHIDSFTLEDNRERPASSSHKEGAGKDSKRIAKMGHKLIAEKQKYMSEKQLLKAKMEIARKQFAEEITKYEQELDGKRQEMQIKLSDLRVEEQYGALSQRMEELAGFREELDSRFLQCVEYEKEIEEKERYLDRRQELCNSKEEDLRLLDDQLDTLHQELELDKERLERAGYDASNMAPRNRSSSLRTRSSSLRSRSSSFRAQKNTDDEDDYILKANLRKCHSDLKKAEQTVQERDLQLAQAREEISSLQSDKTKNKEKIKQLETQLSVALSQLKNQSNSLQASTQSRATINRQASLRSHVSLDRFKSPEDLSINQQAQLNRSLSGKEKGGMSPSGKKYLSSPVTDSPTANSRSRSDGEHSKGSSSDGAGSEGDAGLDFVGNRLRTSTESSVKSQSRTISSACAVM